MVLHYLKNPIILAILVAALVYAYLYWDADRKNKATPNANEKVNPIYPALAAVVTWFAASFYFDRFGHRSADEAFNNTGHIGKDVVNAGKATNYKLVSPESFNIGASRIRLPNNDVFIDVARFD